MTVYNKAPSAVLDFSVDWSSWLQVGETISSVTWTVSSGLTKTSQSNTTTVATCRLTGGLSGNIYQVDCSITTSTGQSDVRSLSILCQ